MALCCGFCNNQAPHEATGRFCYPADRLASVDAIMRAPIGTKLVTAPHNQPLTVVANGDEVTLTSDGGPRVEGWHTEPDGDSEWVQTERWTRDGRTFHGFLHPVSRKLTQTG